MQPAPQPTVRRALIAAAWLACLAAGIVTAVWAVGWSLRGGPQPSIATLESATHLAFPADSEVIESDLSQLHSPTPGDQVEATVEIPSGSFDDFLADNAMGAPLPAGMSPGGAATGTIPPACTEEICYSANIIVEEDAVTVMLTVTRIG